ncbi:MAG: hypothetical protein HRU09_09690 [Oligoflexales bacterium]|nr:hypothetical protein [Oligoflexales bacterium]
MERAKMVFLPMAFLLFLALNASKTLNGNEKHLVIEAPISILSELKQDFDDIDVLGVEFPSGTAQIRLVSENYPAMKQKYPNLEILSGPSLVASNLAGYKSPDEVSEILYQFEANYPELVTGFEVGLSTEGRSIRGLVISRCSEI